VRLQETQNATIEIDAFPTRVPSDPGNPRKAPHIEIRARKNIHPGTLKHGILTLEAKPVHGVCKAISGGGKLSKLCSKRQQVFLRPENWRQIPFGNKYIK
jgi:hypothetical protein